MHWKNWPYWLRGGVIAGLVVIVFFALGEICEYRISQIPNYGGLGLECLPFALPWAPLWFLPFDFPEPYFSVLGFFVWFISGSIVGSIVSIAKKKKSPLA